MAGIGDIVEGTVTSVMPFGAFVTFGSKESGLVHISEISAEYVKDINSVVKRGDRVKAKVIKIDDDGKISLSIKQAAAAPERERKRDKQPKQTHARPDSFDWTARDFEELSFEDRLLRFKHESEEKIRDTKRRMASKRSGGYSRKGYY